MHRPSFIFGIFVVLFVAFVSVLWLMGRELICPCGFIELWHGAIGDGQSSQHLTDWYTFSHVIHGTAFFGLYVLVRRFFRWELPLGVGLLAALFVEMAWEIIENTSWVIHYYRESTASFDYAGDTIINAVFDVLAMIAGFFFAWRAPVWVSVTLILVLELFVLYMIRDNLTLNILMFLYPFETILEWQTGG